MSFLAIVTTAAMMRQDAVREQNPSTRLSQPAFGVFVRLSLRVHVLHHVCACVCVCEQARVCACMTTQMKRVRSLFANIELCLHRIQFFFHEGVTTCGIGAQKVGLE